jgi:rhodanese-related sulfurtransferase
MGIAISPRGDMPKNRVPALTQGRNVSAINSISGDKLARLVGAPPCPALIDVRSYDDFSSDPRLIPGSIQRTRSFVSEWAGGFAGQFAVVVCKDGSALSQGTAAWLRHAGVAADVLEYGFEGWIKAALPLLTANRMPPPRQLAPQAAGVLAGSLGLSRMYADDLAQLEAGLSLYDAFYRWCRDAVDETHTTHAKRAGT